MFLFCRRDKPEPYVAVPLRRGEVAAIGRARVRRTEVPTAAPTDPVRARRRTPRVRLRRCAVGSFPVPHPLPHVPAHVMQPQLVRILRPHWLGSASTVICIPSYFPYCIAPRIRVSPALAPPAGRVLPLGFGGKPVAPLAPVDVHGSPTNRVHLGQSVAAAQRVGERHRLVPHTKSPAQPAAGGPSSSKDCSPSPARRCPASPHTCPCKNYPLLPDVQGYQTRLHWDYIPSGTCRPPHLISRVKL